MQGIGFTGHRKAEITLTLAKAGSYYFTQSFEQKGRQCCWN